MHAFVALCCAGLVFYTLGKYSQQHNSGVALRLSRSSGYCDARAVDVSATMAMPRPASWPSARWEYRIVLMAGSTDGGGLDVRGGDASGTQLQRVSHEQVHGPALRAVGDEELLPGGKLFLKRADCTPVEHIAAGTDGRAQHSMYLCWECGKVTCQSPQGSAGPPCHRYPYDRRAQAQSPGCQEHKARWADSRRPICPAPLALDWSPAHLPQGP